MIAKTEKEYQGCLDFLKGKNCYVIDGTILFYIKRKDKIVCVAGFHKDFGGCIEPLESDDLLASYQLFYFMQGFITGQGYTSIRARTVSEKVKKVLLKSGFRIYTQNEFIKEL